METKVKKSHVMEIDKSEKETKVDAYNGKWRNNKSTYREKELEVIIQDSQQSKEACQKDTRRYI